MSCRPFVPLAVAAALAAGCESGGGGSEAEREGESANAPVAQTVRAFYEAANRPAGAEACALLTARGIQSIVHVTSHGACVRTIDGFAPGSFTSKDGELLHVEGVDEAGEEAFSVDARLEGRSGGTYTVIRRNGHLLIDRFESDEG
jgi:hypothetical protein